MLRLLVFLAALGLAAWGLTWLDDNPGAVVAGLAWRAAHGHADAGARPARRVCARADAGAGAAAFPPARAGDGHRGDARAPAREGVRRADERHDRRRGGRGARGAGVRLRGRPLFRRRGADQAVARADGAALGRPRVRGVAVSRHARQRGHACAWPARAPHRGAARGRCGGGAGLCAARLRPSRRALGGASGARRLCEPRRLVQRADDRRGQRQGRPDRPRDRQPLARGAEDGAGRGARRA